MVESYNHRHIIYYQKNTLFEGCSFPAQLYICYGVYYSYRIVQDVVRDPVSNQCVH